MMVAYDVARLRDRWPSSRACAVGWRRSMGMRLHRISVSWLDPWPRLLTRLGCVALFVHRTSAAFRWNFRAGFRAV